MIPLAQLASWILMLASFPLAFIVLRTVKETNYEDEAVVYVDDVKRREAAGVPAGKEARESTSVSEKDGAIEAA